MAARNPSAPIGTRMPPPRAVPGRSHAASFSPLRSRPIRTRKPGWTPRRLANALLLLVEFGAVMAVLWWVAGTVSNWRALVHESPAAPVRLGTAGLFASALEVLPGSHEAPTAGSIPLPLRGFMDPGAAVVLPEPVSGGPSRIVIEAIGVDSPVVAGDSAEDLKMGVGHHPGSANPGERGNLVLSGHNDVYGEVFRRLDQLAAGDEITVYSGPEMFTYVVRQRWVVEPDDLTALQPSQVPIVTLISCYPYLVDTHRIVVVAELSH